MSLITRPTTLPTTLPLFELFSLLRQQGFLLGTEDYLALLDALSGGFGLLERDGDWAQHEELLRLCGLLWAKSKKDVERLKPLFVQVMQPYFTAAPTKQKRRKAAPVIHPTPLPKSETPPVTSASNQTQTPQPLSNKPAPEATPTTHYNAGTDAITQAAGTRQVQMDVAARSEIPATRYRILTDYFPVTARQMKQSWRYLRRTEREAQREMRGALADLDVEATVNQISRLGYLLAPVMTPRRVNRADLVLLVDCEGSMAPFHNIVRQLIDTAQRGGRLRQASTFYFHDCPAAFVYKDWAQRREMRLTHVLAELKPYTSVLVVSDAGAARGRNESARAEATHAFIKKLKDTVRYCAWLNPMPQMRWVGTTAQTIAEHMVPMFEMSRVGLDEAISVLRGRVSHG